MPDNIEQRSPRPGTLTKQQKIDRLLRVDHAGEYGAVHIYRGQLAVLGPAHPLSSHIKQMKQQEEVHLKRFSDLIRERGTRPSLLSPLWHVAGFALGAGTAMLGARAAMLCTEAVETVIDDHYARQINELGPEEQSLAAEIEEFRQQEVDHRNIAVELGAKEATGYGPLSAIIRFGCQGAIKLAERL
ncbi:MAG: demethoxyubiquinone hydroxylase family protein [Alphaproteobacteria bacterium]|nr:demethoxyubiquinone hydroxylase family protein [Alphaproteobacteria bacterium]